MPKYDPEWIAFEKTIGGLPHLPFDNIDKRRHNFNNGIIQGAKRLPPTDPNITTHDEQISEHVKVRIYVPPDPAGTACQTRPCLVFCHGGGWYAGNLDTEDQICRIVCSGVGAMVVSVDYRLTPRVKFPAPIEDVYEAFQWAYDNASDLGTDVNRYLLWGGSAGGALAIAATYRLVSSGQGNKIAGLISMASLCLHPQAVPQEYQHLHNAYIENGGKLPVVSGDDALYCYKLAGAEPLYDDERGSWFPLTMGNQGVRDFPRTYVITCGSDSVRDDGVVLEATLRDGGVSVKRDNYEKLPHCFWVFPVERAGRRMRDKLVDGIKWILEESGDANVSRL